MTNDAPGTDAGVAIAHAFDTRRSAFPPAHVLGSVSSQAVT